MIVPMKKVYVVARQRDQDRLLEVLGELGVLHLTPVNPAAAVPDEQTVSALDRVGRAIQILSTVTPVGPYPALTVEQAVDQVLHVQREVAEAQARLTSLHHQIEQLSLWGETRVEQVQALANAGVQVSFWSVPKAALGEVQADFVQPLHDLPNRKVLVAVVRRPDAEVKLPPLSDEIPLPTRDRPTLRDEAQRVDAFLRESGLRLAQLANSRHQMQEWHNQLREEARLAVAHRSGTSHGDLYAFQGWVPQDQTADLPQRLAATGLDAALETYEVQPEEEPPTLLRPPFWARPLLGLLRILGTVPGYREFDISWMFMIFLPIFAAILISDIGYGLLYLLFPLIFYKKLKGAGQAALAHLILVVGALSILWGVVICSFFGFDISRWFGRAEAWIPVDMRRESMNFLMLLSVTIGAIHLSLAHLWRAKAALPGLAALSELGWAIWMWGMYGVVKMFLLNAPFGMSSFPYYPWLLIVGGTMAILFASPNRNPLKMLGLGLANFPLSAIGSFGDTVSYLRLMAIGLGGSALALTFNQMGEALPAIGMILVLLVGHALNVALSIVSLLAHGVRLNMLEFSNNLGMQWSGYAYEPFGKRTR